jgi:hypothetical protein
MPVVPAIEREMKIGQLVSETGLSKSVRPYLKQIKVKRGSVWLDIASAKT